MEYNPKKTKQKNKTKQNEKTKNKKKQSKATLKKNTIRY